MFKLFRAPTVSSNYAGNVIGKNSEVITSGDLVTTSGGAGLRVAVAGDAVIGVAQGSATMTSTNATVAFSIGHMLNIRTVGIGLITLVPASGVTFNIPTGYTATSGRQGSNIFAFYVGADNWDIGGDLGP